MKATPELYVEIGHGLAPAAMSHVRRFDGNRAYLGIDKAEATYDQRDGKNYGERVSHEAASMVTYFATHRPTENISFIRGDGRQLPLKNESATEVYMANLITSPIRLPHKEEILAETRRVLKPGGQAVIKMSWDPEWLSPRHEVIKWLGAVNLDVTDVIGTDSPTFAELEELYDPSQHQGDDRYYITATKKLFLL